MILGIETEAVIFLCACLAGATVMAAYGVLVCFRKIVRHSGGAVSAEDFFFWIGCGIYLFRRMYETSYGSIRWYFLLGVVCGAGAVYGGYRAVRRLSEKR